MKLAVYFQNGQLRTNPEYLKLKSELLEAGGHLYETDITPSPDTDMLLSVGGDGTFFKRFFACRRNGYSCNGRQSRQTGFSF